MADTTEKYELTEQQLQDCETFAQAVTRLGIRPGNAPEFFGTSRVTFSGWFYKHHRVPLKVFKTIVEYENRLTAGVLAGRTKEKTHK